MTVRIDRNIPLLGAIYKFKGYYHYDFTGGDASSLLVFMINPLNPQFSWQ